MSKSKQPKRSAKRSTKSSKRYTVRAEASVDHVVKSKAKKVAAPKAAIVQPPRDNINKAAKPAKAASSTKARVVAKEITEAKHLLDVPAELKLTPEQREKARREFEITRQRKTAEAEAKAPKVQIAKTRTGTKFRAAPESEGGEKPATNKAVKPATKAKSGKVRGGTRPDGLRDGTGAAMLVDAMKEKGGKTHEELKKVVGWTTCLPCAMAGAKRGGYKVETSKKPGEATRYHIVSKK